MGKGKSPGDEVALGGGLAPPWMENSTSTALTYSLRVSFFTDIFPLKEIQTISNITDNLNYVAKQQNGNFFWWYLSVC